MNSNYQIKQFLQYMLRPILTQTIGILLGIICTIVLFIRLDAENFGNWATAYATIFLLTNVLKLDLWAPVIHFLGFKELEPRNIIRKMIAVELINIVPFMLIIYLITKVSDEVYILPGYFYLLFYFYSCDRTFVSVLRHLGYGIFSNATELIRNVARLVMIFSFVTNATSIEAIGLIHITARGISWIIMFTMFLGTYSKLSNPTASSLPYSSIYKFVTPLHLNICSRVIVQNLTIILINTFLSSTAAGLISVLNQISGAMMLVGKPITQNSISYLKRDNLNNIYEIISSWNKIWLIVFFILGLFIPPLVYILNMFEPSYNAFFWISSSYLAAIFVQGFTFLIIPSLIANGSVWSTVHVNWVASIIFLTTLSGMAVHPSLIFPVVAQFLYAISFYLYGRWKLLKYVAL